ncbi:hypothetical protein BJ170DRAFT_373607 [Xylariales sp. AK1849]|nr:hypothetical protein BJ170DRAFT_373607 [Xylariales sp. AK1849]
MFTPPVPPVSGFISPTPVTTASSTAPPRPSRLRGLSYLRSYTQSHLSRDSGLSAQNNSASGSGSGSTLRPSLRRAATLSSPSGRRRSYQSVDNTTRHIQDLFEATNSSLASQASSRNQAGRTSAQLRHSHREPPVEASSDSRGGRGKKQERGAGGERVRTQDQETDAVTDMTRTRSATTGDVMSMDMLPTIRLSAHYDTRSNRQSLSFTPVSRTLPTGKETIRVGRYSEREQQAVIPVNTPSAAPVGFKSKVVSRRHCEFWHEDGKWYIKDVKSSSGTFLNHIRLSPPGNESKPFAVNDGDIVQLGIDFRGGEEMIFRCVKMRIELNRGWQAKPNNFNMATHKRLRNLTGTASTASHAQDCSICLNAIAPCQSLFVAPCSHTWHYKCIRELLTGPSHPIFTCPNCRAAADLDADIEEPEEDWQQLESGAEDTNGEETKASPAQSISAGDSSQNLLEAVDGAPEQALSGDGEAGDITMLLDSAPVESASRHSVSSPVPIPQTNSTPQSARAIRTPSPNRAPLASVPHEGPLTPRNDAGPWVFDGDAGRASQEASRQGMVSLDAAATPVELNPA